MRILLLVIFLLVVSLTAGWAKTYSCRDNSGMLHYSDNLQGLPEECIGKVEEVKTGGADNLNFVPSNPEPAGSGQEFEQSVRDADREITRKKQQGMQMRSSAEQLLVRYQQAVQGRRKARTSWNYGSRETIKKADEEIAQIQERKQRLLLELEGTRLARDDEKAVRDLLAGIGGE